MAALARGCVGYSFILGKRSISEKVADRPGGFDHVPYGRSVLSGCQLNLMGAVGIGDTAGELHGFIEAHGSPSPPLDGFP